MWTSPSTNLYMGTSPGNKTCALEAEMSTVDVRPEVGMQRTINRYQLKQN